jgi:metallo-beta-lactamase class B
MKRRVSILLVLLCTGLASAQTPGLRPDTPKQCSSCDEWNAPMAPSRIFGNTYSVGVAGLSAILITSDAGHILIDAGLPQTAPRIDENMRALGLQLKDIKLILNTHAHYDHAAGIAAIQRASGAVVAARADAARAFEQGGPTPDDPQYGFGQEENAFPAVAKVRVIADGEVLRVGDLAVTAHATPGHTVGGTTWSWRSCEGSACRDIVYADSLTPVAAPGFKFTGDATHPSRVEEFRKSIAKVGALPCDILLTAHPSAGKGQSCRSLAQQSNTQLDQRVAEEKGGAK